MQYKIFQYLLIIITNQVDPNNFFISQNYLLIIFETKENNNLLIDN